MRDQTCPLANSAIRCLCTRRFPFQGANHPLVLVAELRFDIPVECENGNNLIPLWTSN